MKDALNRNDSATPRVINPVKISQVFIFSALEELQKARQTLKKNMPWVKVKIFTDPMSVGRFQSEKPSVLLCDDTALNLLDTKAIKKNNPDLIVVLLSSIEMIHCSPTAVSVRKYPYTSKADLIFAVNKKDCAPNKIIASVVRSAEDHLNIEKYSKARRFIFLIVDDEPRWISQFLPVLYGIIGQRAAVKVTQTFEDTVNFLFGVEKEGRIGKTNYRKFGHGDDVVCLITDIFFPKGEDMRSESGTELIRLIDKYYPRFPKIIASKASEADDLKSTAFIMPKGDPGSLQTLRDFIEDYTGMGDFLVCKESGEELFRAKNIRELRDVLKMAEKDTDEGKELREILEGQGERDNFSTWLYMHGFKDLAKRILPIRIKGKRMVSYLREHFEEEIKRVESLPLVIEEKEIFSLRDLLKTLRTIPASKIQEYSDRDVFSNWLDRKGYPELAAEIRPIHGIGQRLENQLTETIEKWIPVYAKRKKLK
ncbi:MAG: hypothetical protein JXB23_01010 [Candidatus Aminicenantes bacterium]|nr:hypothetical protein [Candidatus Aminicenantes bacterium]